MYVCVFCRCSVLVRCRSVRTSSSVSRDVRHWPLQLVLVMPALALTYSCQHITHLLAIPRRQDFPRLTSTVLCPEPACSHHIPVEMLPSCPRPFLPARILPVSHFQARVIATDDGSNRISILSPLSSQSMRNFALFHTEWQLSEATASNSLKTLTVGDKNVTKGVQF